MYFDGDPLFVDVVMEPRNKGFEQVQIPFWARVLSIQSSFSLPNSSNVEVFSWRWDPNIKMYPSGFGSFI